MDRDILIAIFNDLDTDNNGYVDQEEFIDYYTRAEGILQNNIKQEQ
jgi:Ca2+-binding EF-hand superfamily protein